MKQISMKCTWKNLRMLEIRLPRSRSDVLRLILEKFRPQSGLERFAASKNCHRVVFVDSELTNESLLLGLLKSF